MKTQLNVWVSIATKERLKELVERHGTQSEVVATAIERLWLQTFEKKGDKN